MKVSSQNFNKIMIAIGAGIVLLMVISAGLNGFERRSTEKKCAAGDIDVCTKLIESKHLPQKELVMTYVVRGYHYDRKAEYDNALKDFNEAIEMEPNRPEIYLSRAGVYADKGDFANAVPDFNTAIKLSKNPQVLLAAYCGRGTVHLKKGEVTAAGDDLTEARKVAARAPCLDQLDSAIRQAKAAPPPVNP